MELQDLLPVGVTLVVVGLVIAFGTQIVSETREDMCDTDYTFNSTSRLCYNDANTSMLNTTAQLNASEDTLEGVMKFSAKLPLIATVVVAVIIIGILVRYFQTK